MAIDGEVDRLMSQAKLKLSYVVGATARAKDGMDGQETGGLSVILAEVLEGVEAIHGRLKSAWGVV